MRRLASVALLSCAGAASAGVLVEPRVGADFEHFGETYRVTADRDTVSVVDDYGTFAGIHLKSAERPIEGWEIDVEGYAGYSTRRAQARFEGRWKRASDRLELRQEASYRVFTDDGDYTVSGDHFEDRLLASWEHELGGPWSLRLKHAFDGTWYEQPTEYNLTAWTNEPRAEIRVDLGEWSRLRAGVRWAKRDVPDSTTLGYTRRGAEAVLAWLGGESSVEISELLQRRDYDDASVRSSSWENRAEARLELGFGDRATCRLLHENEILRYDDPDDLDYDSDWGRTGLALELHQSHNLDFSVMPVYAFLVSGTSAVEEYEEIGIEIGFDWRVGQLGWISVSNEVGRRNYEVNAPEEEPSLDTLDSDIGVVDAYSDYTYDRLTLLVGADPRRDVVVDLFVHWQPEAHDVRRHDSDTQIVSGGITYKF